MCHIYIHVVNKCTGSYKMPMHDYGVDQGIKWSLVQFTHESLTEYQISRSISREDHHSVGLAIIKLDKYQ